MTKARKVGDWKAVATGRNHKPREMRNGRGLSNVPNMGDVGSAAYRRSLAKQTGGRASGAGAR
jgi:hypothetical protein